jgi:hypothetical protein
VSFVEFARYNVYLSHTNVMSSKDRDEEIAEEIEATRELLTFISQESSQVQEFHETILEWSNKPHEQRLMSNEELLSIQRETADIKAGASSSSTINNNDSSFWKMKVLNATRIQNKSLEHSIKQLEEEIYDLTQG